MLGNLPATRDDARRRRARARHREAEDRREAEGRPRSRRPAAKPQGRRAAHRAPAQPRPSHGPRPVRAGAPALKESTERARSEASEPRERGSQPPSGTELVTTAIQAAGELAQIGLTVGGQVLKRAVKRLPKP